MTTETNTNSDPSISDIVAQHQLDRLTELADLLDLDKPTGKQQVRIAELAEALNLDPAEVERMKQVRREVRQLEAQQAEAERIEAERNEALAESIEHSEQMRRTIAQLEDEQNDLGTRVAVLNADLSLIERKLSKARGLRRQHADYFPSCQSREGRG